MQLKPHIIAKIADELEVTPEALVAMLLPGNRLSLSSDGTLTDVPDAGEAGVAAAIAAIPDATTDVRGMATVAQITKLAGIAANATNIVIGTSAGQAADGAVVAAIPGAANAYADLVIQGFDPKAGVKTVSLVDVATLSGLATMINGVALNTNNMRVLLAAQTDPKAIGIYLVHSGAWTRALDMAAGSDAAGNYIAVEDGTYQGKSWFVSSPTSGTCIVGTDDLQCKPFGGLQLSTATPAAETSANAGAAGSATTASASDHVHPMPALLAVGTGAGQAGDGAVLATAIQQGGTLTAALNGGGKAITNFANQIGTAVNLDSPGGATVLLASTFATEKAQGYLAASYKYFAVMGARIFVWKTANPDTVIGWVDLAQVGLRISMDASNVATVTFNRTAGQLATIWDYSNLSGDALPLNAAGRLALLAATTGGFSISYTEPTGLACTALVVGYWINAPVRVDP
jgi:hypothetical protein